MPYTTAELISLHKASLLDAAGLFIAPADADFLRHLRIACRAVAMDKRPRTLAGSLSLSGGAGEYPAPADMVLAKGSPWGVAQMQTTPWCAPRAPLPTLRSIDGPAGKLLHLVPAPTTEQIAAFGSTYPFYYFASHTLPADVEQSTTVTDLELDLVLLRAKVEALRELTIRNHNKPVTLRAGQGSESQPRNMTAAALYQSFLQEYKDAT